MDQPRPAPVPVRETPAFSLALPYWARTEAHVRRSPSVLARARGRLRAHLQRTPSQRAAKRELS